MKVNRFYIYYIKSYVTNSMKLVVDANHFMQFKITFNGRNCCKEQEGIKIK